MPKTKIHPVDSLIEDGFWRRDTKDVLIKHFDFLVEEAKLTEKEAMSHISEIYYALKGEYGD